MVKNMVKEKDFYKTLAILALPMALQSFMSLGVNMLDNIMVGTLGEVKLSGVALANQFTIFLTFFINGGAGGASVLVSQYWGKNDVQRIRTIFATVFQVMLACVAAISIAIFVFPDLIMRAFTNQDAIRIEAASYLRIISISYIFFALTQCLVTMMRCVEVVRISLIITICSFFTNLFFNYILIFGRLGMPALGIEGAALATVIARAIELCIVAVFVFKFDKRLAIKPRDLLKSDKVIFRDFLRYGTPIIFGDLQWGLVWTSKALIIGRLGTQMIAANNIAETVLSLCMVLANGLSAAACVIIGKSVGEGDIAKTRRYSNTIQILFAIFGFLMVGVIYLIREIPVSFFDVSPETARYAVLMLTIGAVSMLGTTYHAACFVGINRGAGDAKFVVKVDVICGWLVVIPSMLIAAFVLKLPPHYIYAASRIDQFFKWIIAFVRLRGDKWIQNVTRD